MDERSERRGSAIGRYETVQMVVINGDFYKTGIGRLFPPGWEEVEVLVNRHCRLGPSAHRSFAQGGHRDG